MLHLLSSLFYGNVKDFLIDIKVIAASAKPEIAIKSC